jgi:hypothetical protein
MKTVILHTYKRTKSNSFSDALFRTLTIIIPICWLLLDKTDNCPVTINYVNMYIKYANL